MNKSLKASGLAVLMLAGQNLFASDIKIGGSARIRTGTKTEYDFDKDSNDKMQSTSYRFRINVNAKVNNETDVFLQPSFTKTAASTTSGQSSGALNDPDGLDVHQAYIVHSLTEQLSMKVGRQELIYGDQLLIGSVGWSNVGRSFDGWKFSYDTAYGSTDLLLMTIKENGAELDSDRDHDLKGIYHSGKLSSIDNLDLYYLVDEDLTTKSADTEHSVKSTGIRIKSDYKEFDYRVEYTSQQIEAGSNTENANQYDIELGYTNNTFRFAVEHSSASEFYEQMYPTGHKFLGHMDLFKRQNMTQNAVYVTYFHDEKLNITLSGHQFTAVDEDSTAYKWNAPTAVTSDEKDLGTEIDLCGNYILGKNLSLEAHYMTFNPGKRYKDLGLKDQATMSMLNLVAKF